MHLENFRKFCVTRSEWEEMSLQCQKMAEPCYTKEFAFHPKDSKELLKDINSDMIISELKNIYCSGSTTHCLSKEQTPSGDLHAEAGPNPKLNPRSCVNKEEKGKFLPAASGAAD